MIGLVQFKATTNVGCWIKVLQSVKTIFNLSADGVSPGLIQNTLPGLGKGI